MDLCKYIGHNYRMLHLGSLRADEKIDWVMFFCARCLRTEPRSLDAMKFYYGTRRSQGGDT